MRLRSRRSDLRRDEVLERLARHRRDLDELGVKSLALFGSIARDEAGPNNDIDIFVEFSGPIGLLGFVRLQRFLADLLKSRIDLVTADVFKPKVREHVLKKAVHAA